MPTDRATALWTSSALVAAVILVFACSETTPDHAAEPDAAVATTVPAPSTSGSKPEVPPRSAPESGADAGPDAAPAIGYCAFRIGECKRTQASCDEERTCFGAMRPGVGAAVEACVVSGGKCNRVDDCLGIEATKLAGGAGPIASFRDACLAKIGACGDATTLDDDDCVNFVVFPDAVLGAMKACLDKACAAAGACVQAELAKAGCDN